MHSDFTRPRLHFTARSGWINDPLGPTLHGGAFHLFFQHVPGHTVWRTEQRWGHATSQDLLHWREGEVALAPGDGDDGVWSGSVAVPDDGPAALFYTSVDEATAHVGKVRLARPTDDTWASWVKKGVVVELPEGIDVTAFRDPFVLRDGPGWRLIMGAGLTDGTATALSYRSADLESWTYDGPLAARHTSETEPIWTGSGWECPQLFQLDDRWVLTVSVWDPGDAPRYEVYAVGDVADGVFVAEVWGRLSYGPSHYAASAFTDDDGARCLISWLRDVADPAGRWTGAHSLPRRVHLENGRVVTRPHPTLIGARTGPPTTARDSVAELPWVADLEWVLDEPGSTSALTVVGDGSEQLRLDVADETLTVRVGEVSWEMPVGGRDLRVVLDGPVVEVFTMAGVTAAAMASAGPRRTVSVSGPATLHGYPLR